ncbi:alpha/beta fold hydrolase [Phytohabitans aurantiacus]|uniref:Hydrolase n=1 Tax=Phytohabitans aurantiacus TaxID=3016789 RepID=A0ABQ5R0L2_9ACTN|nr:alpha/beta hydrolase [Phytohabitans aurantiacus]GLH99949.1 putative hydrolase [Phytohabitans aurantiacus]
MTTREIHATTADGTRVAATDQGEGPTILIVHPGSSDATSWAGVADKLSYRFRVVRIHRRLYSTGSRPAAGHTMATEVDDVLAIAATLDGPLVLVGHSSGAVVALEAALAAPATFAGLVLYEPPVAVDAPLGGQALLRARAALEAGKPGRAMAIHLREIVKAPRWLVTSVRLAPSVWRRLRAFAPAQISDDEAIEALGVGLARYAAVEVPTCLLGGDRSPANLRQRWEALAKVLPGVRSVVVLRRHGHAAHLTAPTEVAWAVEDFTDSVLEQP